VLIDAVGVIVGLTVAVGDIVGVCEELGDCVGLGVGDVAYPLTMIL
jgi:hypothetical protein